jgi:hypothetical protein
MTDFITTSLLPSPPTGWYEYDHAVLNDGSLGLVRVDRDFSGLTEREANLAWPTSRLRLSSLQRGVECEAVAVTPASSWPKVDRLPDGRWLVVAARAIPGEHNASIFNLNGVRTHSFEVGDNVWHLACTSGGVIWIGYGDESAGQAPPPAGSGLASFDSEGACRWKFDLENYEIQACDAMSTTGEQVWACTDMDFPILRVEDGKIRVLENGIAGAYAIAAEDDYAILAGGYPSHTEAALTTSDRVVLLRLDAQRATPLAELRLSAISAEGAFCCGRDGVLHAVANGQWLRLPIRDWVAALTV